MYVFSIVLIVASNILYNICQKMTPQKANPFTALLITYVTAVALVFFAFKFSKTNQGFFQSLTELNWTSIALGVAIVGLELGYLMAYRAGWNIGIGSLVANIILAIMLIPIGVFLFKEGFGLNKIIGTFFCIIGLILINK
ncbi:membrane protein [Desulfotomaculum defluvii]